MTVMVDVIVKKNLIQWHQIIAAISLHLSILSSGVMLGWPSPMISKLQNPEDNPLHVSITENEETWIGSIILLAAGLGPYYSGIAAKKIGRKIVLLSTSVLTIAAYILIIFADAVWQIYIARILCGLAFGQLATCVPIYNGEIADKNIRGALGSLFQIFISLGFVYIYSIGPYTSYTLCNILCMIPPLVFFISFLFMPETPHYLVSKGKTKEARKALNWLRNCSDSEIQEEFDALLTLHDDISNEKSGYWEKFKKRENVKAFYLAGGLFFFQQFTGINVVQFYLQSIFEKANTGISPVLSAILVGVLQVVFACFTPLVIDKWGRRVLLILSGLGMGISLALLGLYFILDKHDYHDLSSIAWLPVTSVILFMLAFCIGYGSVAWALLGELFSPSIKEVAIPFISSFTYIVGFLIAKYFNSVDKALGTHWAFWIFAILSFVSCLFVYFFLPETKGKTLTEIQTILNTS